MIVIITEKPSVAKDFATYFKAQSKDGYFYAENGKGFNDNVAITWAYGHLLKDRQFEELPKEWSFDNMPIFPSEFTYKPIDGSTGKQIKVFKELIKGNNNVTVINAGDPGREGELIQRLILDYIGYDYKSFKRFWVSEALTEKVIEKGLQYLINGSDFDSLYSSAKARQHADWIMGINLTRATSIQGQGKFSIGRVQTPVLKLITDRTNEIKNFVKSFHYTVTVLGSQNNIQGIELQLETQNQELTKNQAENLLSQVKQNPEGEITDVLKNVKKTKAPNPHSLTSLQQEANKVYEMTAAKTLEIAQSLYEKHKAVSYPRTDSQFLGENTKEQVQEIAMELGIEIERTIEEIGKSVFNNNKLTDHHAIIPLRKIETGDNLTADETKIYNLIKRKFEGIFLSDQEQDEIRIIAQFSGLEFTAKKIKTIKLGWKKLYTADAKDEDDEIEDEIDNYKKLEKGNIHADETKLKEIEKKPQKAYTEASILSRMKSLNLGTPATRADILEKLIRVNYIERAKKNLVSTEKGDELISKIKDRDFTSPELTSDWENKLTDIEDDKTTYENFMEDIKEFTSFEINHLKTLSLSVPKAVLCECTCGGEVITSAKAHSCNKCERIIWKQTFGTNVTDNQAKKLFEGKVVEFKNLKSKAGKKYSTKLHFGEDDKLTFFKEEAKELGNCSCGGKITASYRAYSCDNCKRTVWKQTFGTNVKESDAIKLLKGEAVEFKNLKSKAGKTYSATLHFDSKNKLTFKN